MIFADKLIRLRRQSGWSQEELADQMGVTRQSVSKWEGAQAVPDLEKMVRLSELFGVSTDYLLKDELEDAGPAGSAQDVSALRRVSLEEANAYLAAKAGTARPIALGVLLCILSPLCLFILGALSEQPGSGMSEAMAAGLGLVTLFILVTAAVAVFIRTGGRTAPFEYLQKQIFETEYGVTGMVKERKAQYRERYSRGNIVGACLCVAAPIFLFLGMALFSEDDLLLVLSLCLTLVSAGAGVAILVRVGIVWAGFETLLQENDYSRQRKKKQPLLTAVTAAYWLLAVAVFLALSLATDGWDRTWIVWVVAGVLYPALMAVLKAVAEKE